MQPIDSIPANHNYWYIIITIGFCFQFVVYGVISGQSHHITGSEASVLYDAQKGTDPDEQGWFYLTNMIGESQVVRFTQDGVHRINTLNNIAEMAGYFGTNHPGFQVLDRHRGYSVTINLRLLADLNLTENRGGFSMIVLSEDLLGVEVVFRMNRIWVYTEGFEIAEFSEFDTVSGFVEYTISVKDDDFEVSVENEIMIVGPLRDYSGFGIPYNISNFIFFGDNTSRSGADVEISSVKLYDFKKTGIPEGSDFSVLHQNYPNPFRRSTNIKFELESTSKVKLEVFDISGRKIATPAEGTFPAGIHRVHFDAHGLSAGIYLYRMIADRHMITRKMVLTGEVNR